MHNLITLVIIHVNNYWQTGGAPTGPIADAINEAFGSFEDFKTKFSACAAGHFGSGMLMIMNDFKYLLMIINVDAFLWF